MTKPKMILKDIIERKMWKGFSKVYESIRRVKNFKQAKISDS